MDAAATEERERRGASRFDIARGTIPAVVGTAFATLALYGLAMRSDRLRGSLLWVAWASTLLLLAFLILFAQTDLEAYPPAG